MQSGILDLLFFCVHTCYVYHAGAHAGADGNNAATVPPTIRNAIAKLSSGVACQQFFNNGTGRIYGWCISPCLDTRPLQPLLSWRPSVAICRTVAVVNGYTSWCQVSTKNYIHSSTFWRAVDL